jgi:phage tail sheath gpL-like
MISFSTIPANIRVPLFWAEVDNSAANTTQDSAGALLFGYALPDADIPLNTPVLMPSASEAKRLAGSGSQLARMVEAYRRIDAFGELYCIAIEETGTAATGIVSITGTATSTGAISLYIGTQRVQAITANGDKAGDIARTLAAAINDNPDLAVSAEIVTSSSGVSEGVVALTALNKGATGNAIPLAINYYGSIGGENTPAGLKVTVEPMEGGAGDPEMGNPIAAMADEPFDYIGLPFCTANTLNLIALEMNDTTGRWSYMRQLYGHVYTTKIGELTDLVAFGELLNEQHISVCGYEPLSQTPADELTAQRVAREAVFLRNDPARPTQTGELSGALPPPTGKRFRVTEQQSLLQHGIATAYTESGKLKIQRTITTYKKNAYGAADNSYLDSETLHTLAYVLRRLKSAITSKYGRHKLANDGTRFGPGQAIVTPKVIKGEILAAYLSMERAGIVENFEIFKKYLIVERNEAEPTRLDVLFPPDLVNQLRIFAVLAQFRLQYTEEEAA